MHSLRILVVKKKVSKSIRTKQKKNFFPKVKTPLNVWYYIRSLAVIFWDTFKISHGTLHLKTNKKKNFQHRVYLARNDNIIKLNQPDDDLYVYNTYPHQ